MSTQKGHSVYHLIDPITNQVKYVGKSTNPKRRYTQHLSKLDSQQTPKRTWLEGLFARGMQPILKVVSNHASETEARDREQLELNAHRSTALNIHNPGKGQKSIKWK